MSRPTDAHAASHGGRDAAVTDTGRCDLAAETDGELALLLTATAEMLDNEPETVWVDRSVRAAAKRLRDALSDRLEPT